MQASPVRVLIPLPFDQSSAPARPEAGSPVRVSRLETGDRYKGILRLFLFLPGNAGDPFEQEKGQRYCDRPECQKAGRLKIREISGEGDPMKRPKGKEQGLGE